MLAVSRTASATGWMNKLIVSIATSIGISIAGVPCGRKWAKEAFVLWRNPNTTVAAQSGMAIPRFIDSCVVGVKEWGSRPSRLVDPMNMIREINIRDQARPLLLWISIICFRTSLINHCWNVAKRLLVSRLGDGKKMLGNRIMRVTIGRPASVGVAKEANKFSFIFFLKVSLVFCILEGVFGG